MVNDSKIGNISVLGCTGSIGTQTLDVVRANPEHFRVVAIAAKSNADLLIAQAREFHPEFIAVLDKKAADILRRELGKSFCVEHGEEALVTAATFSSAHTVVVSVVGFSGLMPLLAAIECGKHIALANKESLVAAGQLVMDALRDSQSVLVPVDSEHNSVFQCLLARRSSDPIRKVVLTASGGPFLNFSSSELQRVTPEDAVCHPRWNMGAKISVDSATMMNKGLEVIEASWLFGLPASSIEVLIHPQSLVHGLVEYEDGSLIAALFETDMRVPITVALSHLRSKDPATEPGARRFQSSVPFLDLAKKDALSFTAPDFEKFPLLNYCYEALGQGGTMPTVVNAANEVAVNAFLCKQISFVQIPEIVANTMQAHDCTQIRTIADVILADTWARKHASNTMQQFLD